MGVEAYSNIDGTDEMTTGGALLAMSLLNYIESLLPPKPHGYAARMALAAVIATLILLGWLGIRLIKRRVTWPRTGYMVSRGLARTRMTAFLGGAAAVVALYMAFRFRLITDIPRLVAPVVFVLLYGAWVFRFGHGHRWKPFVPLVMAAELAVIALAAPARLGALWPCFFGLTWLASGLITLYLYIRHTHPPAPEES